MVICHTAVGVQGISWGKCLQKGESWRRQGGADPCERRRRRKMLGKKVTDSSAAPGKLLAVAREWPLREPCIRQGHLAPERHTLSHRLGLPGIGVASRGTQRWVWRGGLWGYQSIFTQSRSSEQHFPWSPHPFLRNEATSWSHSSQLKPHSSTRAQTPAAEPQSQHTVYTITVLLRIVIIYIYPNQCLLSCSPPQL